MVKDSRRYTDVTRVDTTIRSAGQPPGRDMELTPSQTSAWWISGRCELKVVIFYSFLFHFEPARSGKGFRSHERLPVDMEAALRCDHQFASTGSPPFDQSP